MRIKITKISDSLKEYNKRVQEKYAKYDSGKGDSKNIVRLTCSMWKVVR